MVRKESELSDRDEAPAKESAKKKGSPAVLGAAMFVMVICLLGGGIYYFQQMQPGDVVRLDPIPITWPTEEHLSVQQTLLGGMSLLQVDFSLGLLAHRKDAVLLANMDRLRHKVIDIAGEIVASLDDQRATNPSGREYIKLELKTRMNQVLRATGAGGEVQEVYLSSYSVLSTGG